MKLTNDNHLRINGDELAKELGYQNGLEMREALARMRRMKPSGSTCWQSWPCGPGTGQTKPPPRC